MNEWFVLKEAAKGFAYGALFTISILMIVVAVMLGAAAFAALGEYGFADGWKPMLIGVALMVISGGISCAVYTFANLIA